MKERYISPEMELIEFDIADIIVTSDLDGGYDPEGWT